MKCFRNANQTRETLKNETKLNVTRMKWMNKRVENIINASVQIWTRIKNNKEWMIIFLGNKTFIMDETLSKFPTQKRNETMKSAFTEFTFSGLFQPFVVVFWVQWLRRFRVCFSLSFLLFWTKWLCKFHFNELSLPINENKNHHIMCVASTAFYFLTLNESKVFSAFSFLSIGQANVMQCTR